MILQGGGALGAYQAGVYQALAEANLHPDWVAGISIGAINAALIAGNPKELRLEKLRGFWDAITADPLWAGAMSGCVRGYLARGLANQVSAGLAAVLGSLAAYGFVAWVMEAPFVLLPGAIALTASLGLAATLALGFAGTWRALGQKPASHLRNE